MIIIGRFYPANKAKSARRALILFLLFLLMPLASGAEPVLARYVRIDLPGEERTLSLAEVQVYSGNKLISSSGKANQVTTFRSAVADKAIDGNASGAFFNDSVTHTQPGKSVWWELDLGSDREITKLVIHNRTDCCGERINPAQIVLRDSARKIAWQNTIESTQKRYEIDVNPATTRLLPQDRNLLRNATFRQSTNPPLPDYWDLHHAAALTFKDLHRHYGIDTQTPAPLPGVGVLRIVNSADDFRYVILMPSRIVADLPNGDYTYSVYVKADRDAVINVSQAWGVGREVARKVSTEWQRYAFTFKVSGGAGNLQPVMYFPKKATYFIAAPLLEEGATASPFEGRYHSVRSPSSNVMQKLRALANFKMENAVSSGPPARAFQSSVEYDYYTTQGAARLRFSSLYKMNMNAGVACADTPGADKPFFRRNIQVPALRPIYLEVPIKHLPTGAYRCTIKAFGRGVSPVMSTVDIRKLAPNPIEVRFNTARRFFTLNNIPFHIVGMAIRPGDVPDWYFSELKEQGINTVFYSRTPDKNGQYDIRNFESVVTAAAKYDLKVIVGLAMAGAKPRDARARISGFLALIEQLKEYPQIIGWYPVDEPSANTWQDSELIDFYNAVKQQDPYRLVFVNWAYDGVPKQPGRQPRGTLDATDVYAIDYYPFTGPSHNLSGFTEITARAALTAGLYNKPFFSWLQLFGGNDAWREPSGAELNYMAYANFIYGGMIGYWDTKSNSAATWERIKTINQQAKMLAQKLFLSDDAFQVLQPVATEKFLYTAWKKGARVYLIVLNRDSVATDFSYDVASLTGGASKASTVSMFGGRKIKTANGRIDDRLGPYGSEVYEVVPQR